MPREVIDVVELQCSRGLRSGDDSVPLLLPHTTRNAGSTTCRNARTEAKAQQQSCTAPEPQLRNEKANGERQWS
eukprot:1339251-Alexandrium_andersonii.AAC.1